MTEPAILEAFRPVVEALDHLGIGYYIGGSVASSLYGAPRSTADADLIADIRAEHAEPLADALGEDYYCDADMIREAVARKSMFNVVHLGTAIKVDVYVLKREAWDLEAFARRRTDTFPDESGGRAFCIGTAEDILLAKLAWFRLGGEMSDRQWGDILGILHVQRDALDADYLERWASVLDVTDLLAKARRS